MQDYPTFSQSSSAVDSLNSPAALSMHRPPNKRLRKRKLLSVIAVGVVLLALVASLVLVALPQDVRNQAVGDPNSFTFTVGPLCTPWIEQTNLYPFFSESYPGSAVRSVADFSLAGGIATQSIWLQAADGSQQSLVRTSAPGADFRPDWSSVDSQPQQGFAASTDVTQLITSINRSMGEGQKLSPAAKLIDQSLVSLPTGGVLEHIWMADAGQTVSFYRPFTKAAQFFLPTAANKWTRQELIQVVPTCAGKEVLAGASRLDVVLTVESATAAYTETVFCGAEVYTRAIPLTQAGAIDWAVAEAAADKGWKLQDARYLPADMSKVLAFSEEFYPNVTGEPDYGSLMREIHYMTADGSAKQALQALPLNADFSINTQAGYENCQGIQ